MTEAEAQGHEGLAGTFHEKVISLDTMELRLLVPTAVAIAIVVASAILLAARDLPWPIVSAGVVSEPALGDVPLPVAVLAAITVVTSWSFVLAGALHAHVLFRVVGVGAYALIGLVSAVEADSMVGTPMIALVVLSVVVAAVGLYVADRANHRQAPHLHHRSRLRLPTFGWVLLATTLIYGLLALSGFQTGRLAEFISLQLSALLFLLIPVLFLAGTDFAEWAEVASGRLSSVLEKLPRAALLSGLVVVAGAVLGWAYLVLNGGPGFSLRGTVRDLLPVLFVAPPVALVGGLSLRRSTSTRVPFWALATGAAILYLGLFASSAAPVVSQPGAPSPHLQPMVAARGQADPEYWLLVPQAWRRAAVPQGRIWSGRADGRPARLVLLWGSSLSERELTSVLGAPLSLHRASPARGWSAFRVSTTIQGRPAGGPLWTRRAGGHTWILAGIRAGGATQGARALFEAARESWTPDSAGGGEGGASNDGPGYFLIWLGGAAVVLLGLGLALLLEGRGELATGGLFLTLCGLFAAVGPWVGGEVAQLVGASKDYVAMGTLNLVVTAAFAALLLAALTAAIPRWRLPLPVLRLVFVLLLGFVCLEVLYDGVFGTALAAGARFSVIAGVVLLAAMLWDVLMSGESFTNTGGPAAPRHTRVLLYLGYILMVVAAVLFLGSEQVQGGGLLLGTGFESDQWPRDGIAMLGPPLLLTFFFVNLGAWRRARPMGRADGLDQVDRSVLDEVGVD